MVQNPVFSSQRTIISKVITPVDVARMVGLDPNTARRYLKDENPVQWERTRKKWDACEMPRLMAICESKRQRRCFNKLNATHIALCNSDT